MSDALEALTQVHDLIMHNTVTEIMSDGEPDWPEWACEAMAKIKRACAAQHGRGAGKGDPAQREGE